MVGAEAIAYWVAVAALGVASIATFAAVVWKRSEWLDRAWIVAFVSLVALGATIGIRWHESGHFPYIEQYENVLVGAFAMVLAYLLVSWKRHELRVSGALVLPVALISLGYGLTAVTSPGPVTPPYQSLWLVVHVTFAWFSYAAYTVVAGLAAALLLRLRAEKRGTEARLVPSWIPSSEKIDDLSLKLVAFGFLNNGIMIASGAIWAYRLWGTYWSWDPVETWSLLTWLAYGLYLHARLTLGWRGKRLAWLALFALFGVMMTFWGVQLAPTSYHLFRDLGRGRIGTSRPM